MTVNPIIPGKQNPAQVTGTQGQGSKREFDSGLQQKSEGYTDQELEKAVRDRTKITRNAPADNKEKKQTLYLVPKNTNNNDVINEPVYRTVMVDGSMHTIKLLGVA